MTDGTTAKPNPDGDRPWCRQSQSTAEIVKAVCAAMKEVGVVAKTGWNAHSKYKYASDADLLFAIQPELVKQGLCWRCVWVGRDHDLTDGKMKYRTRVDVVYRLHHTSGEWMDYAVTGEGADNADKGVYKALTGAYKYLQRHAFSLPTGDDAENDGRLKETEPPPEPWANVAGLWADTFDPLTVDGHIWPFLQSKKKAHPADMKTEQRSKALAWLQNGGSSQLAAFLEQTTKDLRGAFMGAYHAIRPTPLKRDAGEGFDLAKAAHTDMRHRVQRHMYGVDSLNDVTPAQALGTRGIGWIRESGEFETVVGEVES